MKEYEELGVHREGHYSVKYKGFVLSCTMYYHESNWYCTYGRSYLVESSDNIYRLSKNGSDEFPIINLPQDELVKVIDIVLENYPEIFI